MAIDPLTAKLLAQAAARAATDEESRRRTLILILSPILSLLLLIAFILYLITSPFSVLSQWLIGDEVGVVEDFQKEYGYNQQLGIYEKDYIEGSGQSYEGVVFTDGGREVIYYNQLDERWADTMYGTSGTIGEAGCGPTAMAIVTSTLTGTPHNPVELSEWSVANGHRCEGNGSYHSLIPAAAEAYGLSWESVPPMTRRRWWTRWRMGSWLWRSWQRAFYQLRAFHCLTGCDCGGENPGGRSCQP